MELLLLLLLLLHLGIAKDHFFTFARFVELHLLWKKFCFLGMCFLVEVWAFLGNCDQIVECWKACVVVVVVLLLLLCLMMIHHMFVVVS